MRFPVRVHDAADWRRRFRLAAGVALVAVGVFGTVRSVRASLSQRLYHMTKHGFFVGTPSLEVLPLSLARDAALVRAIASADPEVRSAALAEALETAREGARRCQRAEPGCPENYYFPALAAQLQLDALLNVHDAETATDLKRTALFFAKKAIRLDPYEELVRRTYVDALLANGEVDEALAFWEPVVDREYWVPDNHDVYARILLRKGSRKDGEPFLARAAEERFLVADPALRKRLENLAAILAED